MKITKHNIIGTTEAICPYCNKELPKMPSRKTKCKNCGNFYFARTRLSDRKKVVLTEEEAKIIEEQWMEQNAVDEFNKEYLEVKEDYDEVKRFLTSQTGREPRDYDILWATYNRLLAKHAELFNWGIYRNIRFKMAQLLIREKRFKQALESLLEICYLDINGPVNCGKIDWELFKKFPPFNKKLGFFAPGILKIVNDIITELNISKTEVANKFILRSEKLFFNLKILPLKPKEVWLRLENEVKEKAS